MTIYQGDATDNGFNAPDDELNDLAGGAGDDTLFGGHLRDVIHGESDDDVLIGLDGGDSIDGGVGNDRLSGDTGDDVLIGGFGLDSLDGGEGDDRLFAGTGGGTVNGGAGDDTFSTFSAEAGVAYTLNGGLGDDVFILGVGADRIDGGFGEDAVSYEGSTSGVTVNLATGRGSGGSAQGDTYVLTEAVFGSTHDDILTGNGAYNTLYGLDGDDRIVGGVGGDALGGGAGFDILDYAASSAGVGVDLLNGLGYAGHADGDSYLDGFEKVIGSRFDDQVLGGTLAEEVRGGDGADGLGGGGGRDKLYGDAGADTLVGGEGGDRLYGGAGADRFRFETPAESQVGTNRRDVINDFARDQNDVIDLGAIDARTTQNNDQAFTWISGSFFTGVAGQLRIQSVGPETTLVQGDVDGDAQADFAVLVRHAGVPALAPMDFIL